jgi:hypothetical protein
MPYAPGINYQAGELFSKIGPRINANVEAWNKNREERDQAHASAEMVARYLKDDPEAVAMFGDKLANIPKMSTGAAKGLLGEATMFLTQRHLKATEADQQARTGLLQQEQARLAGEAASKLEQQNRLGKFNQLLMGHFNQPSDVEPPLAPNPVELDPGTALRYMSEANVLGDPNATSLLNAINTYQNRIQSLPLGRSFKTEYGDVITGLGPGVAPNIRAPKEVTPKTGLPRGQSQVVDEGTWVGAGEDKEPKFIPNPDPPKVTDADKTFLDQSANLDRLLLDLENTVTKYGNVETGLPWVSNPEAAAKLKALPYEIAIAKAKIVDPGSVAREGEVKAAQKYLIPMGWTMTGKIKNSETLAAIKAQREDLAARRKTWEQNRASTATPRGAASAGAAAPEFKSAGDVVKALNSGQISREQAKQILVQRFGVRSRQTPASP